MKFQVLQSNRNALSRIGLITDPRDTFFGNVSHISTNVQRNNEKFFIVHRSLDQLVRTTQHSEVFLIIKGLL